MPDLINGKQNDFVQLRYLADVPGSFWWVCSVVSPPPPWQGPPLCSYLSLNKFLKLDCELIIISIERKVGIRVNNNIKVCTGTSLEK
jgi:hypothetical protein